jgi:hypothetical protein
MEHAMNQPTTCTPTTRTPVPMQPATPGRQEV